VQLQTEITSFFNKIIEIYKDQKPFVAYRKPNEELVSLLVQNNNKLIKLKDYNEQGFIFMPFNNNGVKVLFPLNESSTFHTKITQYNELSIRDNFVKISSDVNFENYKEAHIALVTKGLNFINEGKAKKVVLSRKETIEISHFNLVNSFKKMLKNYLNAFVYVWFHPKVGLWMGATPERLLNVKNNSFKTMALAGTQPFLGTTDVIWEKKEKQEQQFVTDFIIDSIKEKLNVKEIIGPYTIKAGSLVHLRTDIVGELLHLNMLEDLVTALHPTPAICGLPKSTALQFILDNENYARTYYSGYFGELNINNSTQLFVNLRCMHIINNKAELFIGGGITVGSIPEKEFEETVSKAQIMKTIL
jgi:isochorismate synthase